MISASLRRVPASKVFRKMIGLRNDLDKLAFGRLIGASDDRQV